VLIEPGTCVAVEDPGYPPAREAFAALGARVVPVKVDGDGLDVAALPREAKLVYVTPSHQYPLGTAMSLARRLALLAWAERHGAAIIEDDYDSDFRFDGRPLEPLQSLDRHGHVIYVGTFSKALLPALRVGFAIAPASLMPSLALAKQLADSHGALDVQLALAELIDDGLFARHLRRVLRIYGERRAAVIAGVEHHLGDVAELLPASAGLHVSLYFRDRGVATAGLVERALVGGIAVELLQSYYLTRPRAGLVLGFGQIAAPKIDDGLRRLAEVVRSRSGR
jgi:GntR family transcriptional regulator/MocR family aminotransferase